MKKISYLLGCALAAFVFVSCTENGPEPGSGVGASGSTVLTASVEALALISNEVVPPSVEEGNEVATLEVTEEANAHVWAKTDKLGVFGTEGGSNAKYTLFNESVDQTEGKFYGPEVLGDVYAYYPWVEGATSNGSQLELAFPSVQVYNADVKGQFAQNAAVLVAKAVDGALEFLYPLGCFGIGIKGDVDVQAVTLSSKSKPLSGTLALDYENNFAVSAANNSSRSVKLVVENPVHVDMDVPTTFYLMIPPGTYDDLVISIDTNEGTFGKDLVGEYTVERLSLTDFEGSVGNTVVVADFELLTLDGEADTEAKVWEDGAVMGIFAGDAVNSRYSLMRGEAGKAEASFKGIEAFGDLVAYYPYSADAKLEDSKLTLPMPATQNYNSDIYEQFKENVPFVVAQAAEGEKLTFEYVTGVIAVKVKADCTVKSVALSSVNKPIAGNMVVDLANGNAITPAAAGTRSLVTLNCGEGVATTIADPTTFYVQVPPATYNGLAVRVATTEGDTLIANLDSSVVIEALKTAEFAKDVAFVTITVSLDPTLLANASNKQVWTADDALLVYDATSATVKQGVLLSGENTTTASFKIIGAAETDVYEWVAAGPSMALLQENLTFNYTNNNTLNGEGNVYGTGVRALFARGKNNTFSVKSLMGCMAIRIKGSGNLLSVSVKNGKTPIASDAKVAVEAASADKAAPVTTFMKNMSEPTYIYINSETGVALSSSEYTTVYVDVPAGITWNALQIGVMTDQGSFVKCVDNVTVNANAAPVNVADIDFAAIASKVAGATALDAGGTYANCYIVEPNGADAYYSFELKHVNGAALANDQMAGAEWVYAQTAWTYPYNLIDEVYLSRADAKVYFRHGGSLKGNAKLAITDDKFKVGWTYHIWGTDRPRDIKLEGVTSSGTLNYYPWMDRNIGATYAPHTVAECKNISHDNAVAACGFTFQYGNPNGYPGLEIISAETKTEPANTYFQYRTKYIVYGFDAYVSGSFKSSDALKASADGAISYPNYAYSKSVTSISKWFNGDINCLSSATTDPKTLWITKTDYPYQNSPSDKGKYDPCPYGYCIPNQGIIYRSLEKTHKYSEADAKKVVTTRFYTTVWVDDNVAYGQYTVNEAGDGVYWFPYNGYGITRMQNMGGSGYLYAARNGNTTVSSLNGPAYMYCSSNKTENAAKATFSQSFDGPKQIGMTTGYGVRCIRQMKGVQE